MTDIITERMQALRTQLLAHKADLQRTALAASSMHMIDGQVAGADVLVLAAQLSGGICMFEAGLNAQISLLESNIRTRIESIPAAGPGAAREDAN